MNNDKVKKVNVGVIGLGWISNVHLNVLKKIPEVELIAVCARTEEKARRAAIEYGAKKYYTNYEKLLEDNEIDMVDILLPTELHAEAIIKALEAGKNVIVEKPIARTLE
jgi:predicted dehydrogenase